MLEPDQAATKNTFHFLCFFPLRCVWQAVPETWWYGSTSSARSATSKSSVGMSMVTMVTCFPTLDRSTTMSSKCEQQFKVCALLEYCTAEVDGGDKNTRIFLVRYHDRNPIGWDQHHGRMWERLSVLIGTSHSSFTPTSPLQLAWTKRALSMCDIVHTWKLFVRLINGLITEAPFLDH